MYHVWARTRGPEARYILQPRHLLIDPFKHWL